MLMLSLNHFIGRVHVSAAAVLDPPQILSSRPSQARTAQHLTPPVTHGFLYVNSEPLSNRLSK